MPGCSSGRFLEERLAWLQALIQKPQAAPREGLCLDDLVILSRPMAVRGERIAGGPVYHAGLTKIEKPARPACVKLCHATS